MENVLRLLELLTEEYPPGAGKHHFFALADEKDGVLALGLWLDGLCRTIYFTDSDFKRKPEKLMSDVRQIVRANA